MLIYKERISEAGIASIFVSVAGKLGHVVANWDFLRLKDGQLNH
jgi:hypothetical protein